jgi:hypothetical protein
MIRDSSFKNKLSIRNKTRHSTHSDTQLSNDTEDNSKPQALLWPVAFKSYKTDPKTFFISYFYLEFAEKQSTKLKRPFLILPVS